MKPKTMILMVVAVGCGLGASYMTAQLLAKQNNQPPQEQKVAVLVAKKKIPPWMPIKDPGELFELREYPQAVAPKKGLKSFDQVKDQRLNKIIDEDKPVTEDDILTKEQESLAMRLQPGERGGAIRVTPEQLAGGFVFPGSHVDVICMMRGNETSTKVILQDMRVLAVDTQAQRKEDQSSMLGSTVTLAGKPEEINRLHLGASLGELRLWLRAPGDKSRIEKLVSRPEDFEKPLTTEDKTEQESKVAKAGAIGSLPVLPDEVVPKGPPAEAPKAEAPKAESRPVERPVKKHVMTLRIGPTEHKAIFLQREGDDDEDGTPAGDAPVPAPRPEAKPAPKPEAKPAPKPAAQDKPEAKPAPPATFGKRSTRTDGRPR